MTPQEVQEKRFQKAVFGGYDMEGVDTFLETLSEDYATLFKENAILKNKMKVLVDKIEEYRSVDDVMRKTLLTAQQNAQNITQSAKQQADEVMKSAENAARERIAELKRQVDQEEARLTTAKQETIRFVGQLRGLYAKELELLAAIPELPVEESPKSVRSDKVNVAAQEIEDSLAARIAEEDARIAREISSAVNSPEPAAQAPVMAPAQTPAPSAPPAAEPVKRVLAENPLPGDARVYEVKFGDVSDNDFSDIWEPEEDTVVPRPRTHFEDLDLEFGPNYSPAGKGKKG